MFETLEKDVAIIQERLGLEIRSNIQHLNPSFKRKSKDYKEYCDEEERDLVALFSNRSRPVWI